jgi:simple sugar transport system permease protein
LPGWREVLGRLIALREGSIIVVTIIVAVYFSVNTSTFFTGSNFKTLLPYFAPLAILGAGEVFVMILGEIDLSIGAMYMFAPIVFYKFDTAGLGLVPSVILALLVCMAVGALTGAFVSFLGVSSFVTTLGMLFSFEGLSLILSHGTPVATPAHRCTRRRCRSTTSSTATASRCPKKSIT